MTRAELLERIQQLESVHTSKVCAYEIETGFLAQRVAWHLAHGCDTAQRARELALAEWDAGVLGVTR